MSVVALLASGALATDTATAVSATAVSSTSVSSASVSPASGLRDGQTVTVTVTGGISSSYRQVLACVAGATDLGGCDLADIGFIGLDSSGSGTLEWTIAAQLYTRDGGVVDCRSVACRLVVADPSSETPFADQLLLALDFDPTAPLLPPPTVVATPTGGLVNGQTITVSGSGFRRGYPVLSQCEQRGAGIGDCDAASQVYPAVTDGAFSTSFVVFSALDGPGGRVDCRPASCALTVALSSDSSRADTIALPLGFDPDGPLPPIPTVTTTPSTNLRDGQVVTVNGSGFRPGASVLAFECVNATPQAVCDFDTASYANVAPDGTFGLSFGVSALLSDSGSGAATDCRTVEEPCVLRVSPFFSGGFTIPLGFDPDAPTLPTPTISAAPTTDLGDGHPVRIVGEHFRPGAGVSIQQCVAGDDHAACDASGGSYVTAGPDGLIDTTLPVWVDIVDYEGGRFACDAAPGCELRVEGSRLGRVDVPLMFGPRPPSRGRYYDPVFDDVSVQRDVVYRTAVNSRGELVDLKIDVYQPIGDTAPVRPAMVWFHGGYFSGGDKSNMEDYARDSAARGFVSASVQYRLRPEIGSNIDARSIEAMLDAYDDADAAIAWLGQHADEYRIDPEAISAGGYSAGAVTSLNLAYLPGQRGPAEPRVAAAVSIAGAAGGTPEVGEPPSLMFHGDADTTLPYAWGASACAAIESSGAGCELVTYPGSGHEIVSSRARDIVRRTATFLADTVVEPLGFLRPAPSADAGGPYTVDEGSVVRLDGRRSRSASGGPLAYSWSPGADFQKADTPRPFFLGRDDGTQEVTLSVREGRVGDEATTRVRTRNRAPRLRVAAVQEFDRASRTFVAGARLTDPGIDDTHIVAVDWGDSAVTAAVVAQHPGSADALAAHRYLRAGRYTVRITARDDDGGTASRAIRVTVR